MDAKHYPVMGAGVWGVVQDMRDGTVLKRARETGGIGSGSEKIMHEVAMMRLIEAHKRALSFAIPQVTDFGKMPTDEEGFTLWLRSTKLPGRVYQTSDFVNFSEDRRRGMIESMVKALASFHRMLDLSPANDVLRPNFLWREMEKMGAEKADMERLGNVRAMFRDDARIRAVHGDFNITNILFDEKNLVSGVIDFAEMRLASVEEELSALTTEFPESRGIIVSLYEEATGVKIDAAQLRAAEAKSELLSLFIARYRKNDEEAAQAAEGRLAAVMRT